MATKFYPLSIKEIVKTTPECSLITFDVKEEWKDDFQFTQGQHLTLKAEINGEEVRRTYSLCSSPNDQKWQVAVKKVEDGKFSTYANETLHKGDTVEVITGVHKGETGSVLQVITSKDQVIVEGVRMIKKHTRRSQDRPEGGIIEREGPIHISNVKLVSQA